MRRTSRRVGRDTAVQARGTLSEPRTLARYRREVVALLAVGHKIPMTHGLRLIKKWDKYVRRRWSEGRPPCNVADHISKFERERLVKPARDPKPMRGGKWVFTRKKFRQTMFRPGGRDADNPRLGEIYETRAGNRWEVVSVRDKLITVKRAGNRSEGPFQWGKETLKGMKEVRKPFLGGLFSSGAEKKEEPAPTWPSWKPTQGDPDARRKRKKTLARKAKRQKIRKTTKRASKTSGKVRPDGAHCSTAALTARRQRIEPPPHTCKKSTVVQSLVFQKWCWSLHRAKAWALRHGYKTSKMDETKNSYRFRQLSPESFKVVGQMPFMRGLQAVIGCPQKKTRK